MKSLAFSYKADRPKWLTEREEERKEVQATPNPYEMYETFGDSNRSAKKNNRAPTDEISGLVYGVGVISSQIGMGLAVLRDYITSFKSASDRATEADYERAKGLPLYEHMNHRQRLKALDKIVKEREHFSKQECKSSEII